MTPLYIKELQMRKYLPWIAAVVIGFFVLGPLGSLLGVAIYAGVQHFAK